MTPEELAKARQHNARVRHGPALSGSQAAKCFDILLDKIEEAVGVVEALKTMLSTERDRADEAESNFESLLGDIKRAAGVFLDGAEGGGEFDCLLDRVDAAIIRAESGRVTS